MTKRERHLRWLMKRGKDATLTIISGDTCPCKISRGSNFSEEWHSNNLSAEHCLGTGLINRTTATVAVKSVFTTEIETLPTFISAELKLEIGRLQNRDLVMFGCCQASDGTFYDMTQIKEHSDTVTYRSKVYVMRHHMDLDDIMQIGVLKEKEV